ncbi:hypothetical protein [Pseudomonas sp. Irchel 3H3]|uniref:hypothetical protein n=1 Tax=Pseudomonas sp. Irchel 3H3 TaxID=2009038 RepID=UPI002113B065|nr:hypothetical protein [Pseudomonas sp. Irchel 3H3]
MDTTKKRLHQNNNLHKHDWLQTHHSLLSAALLLLGGFTMNFPCNKAFPFVLMFSFSACVQAADSLSSTTRFQEAGWYLEQPDPYNPIASARLKGEASHGDRTSPAILQVTCFPSPRRADISLYTSTAQLGFNPEPFHGPDAVSTGPLSLTTGKSAPLDYAVNGFYTAEQARKGDFVFSLFESTNHRELNEWTTETTRGQPINMTLPSAIEGDLPLVATFVLPQDDSGLRKVIGPCLSASGSADRR